jgi:hypothetical protein
MTAVVNFRAMPRQVFLPGFNTKPKSSNHLQGRMFAIIVPVNSASPHSWMDSFLIRDKHDLMATSNNPQENTRL